MLNIQKRFTVFWQMRLAPGGFNLIPLLNRVPLKKVRQARWIFQPPYFSCGKGLAVEHDGEVYSCDHFVYPEYRLGNIADTHLGDMAFSVVQEKFGMDKRDTLPTQCQRCDYHQLCWGECPKNRLIKSRDGESGMNYLCSGLYHFYEHIGPDVVRIMRHLGKLT